MRFFSLITVIVVFLGCGAADQKVDLASARVLDSLLLFNDYGELTEKYGKENVRVILHTINDNGESASAAILFPGTRSEVLITWGDEPYVPAVEYYRSARVSVKTAGLPEASTVKGWKTSAGVALGLRLHDIETISGGPHKLVNGLDSVYGWDGALSDHRFVFDPSAYNGEDNPQLQVLSVVGFFTNPKSTYVFDSPMDDNVEEEEAAAAADEEASRREAEARPDYIALPENDSGDEMSKFLEQSGWKNSRGEMAGEEDAPGTVTLYFVSDDGKTLPADADAPGAAIPPASISVDQVRVEVIPKIKGDFNFSVQTDCNYAECANIEYTKYFADAEPGKAYSIVIQDDDQGIHYLCSAMRIAVRSGGWLTVTTVENPCK